VAAAFNPAEIAVLNTVVVFGPRSDLTAVPFDAVLLSNLYSFFYVLAGRRSFQNKISQSYLSHGGRRAAVE